MGHFRDAHRTCLAAAAITDTDSNCTLPGEDPLQVDRRFNHTNGLLRRNAPTGKRPNGQLNMHLSSVSSKSLILRLATVVQVAALSVVGSEASLGHNHATHHAHRHPSAHSIPFDLPSQMMPFNASNSLIWAKTALNTIEPSRTNVFVPSPTAFSSLSGNSYHSSSPASTTHPIFSSTSTNHPKVTRSIHSTDCKNTLNTTTMPNCSLVANKLVDMKANANQRGTSSTSSNSSSASDFYNSSWNVRLIWYTVFGVMITVGIVANLLVVATIGGHKSLHTITNCFLLNLTVSDLLTLIFNANFNLYFLLSGHWPFGRVFCVVNNFITNLTIFSSVCTIMFTSKERYNAIVRPLRKRMTKQRAFVHIFIIWFGATLFAVPALVFSRTLDVRSPSGPLKGEIQQTVCLLKWPDGYPWQSRFDFIYNLLFLVLTYTLPLMTMGIAYTLMARVLWGSKQIGESTQAQMKLVCSKQKVVRMLICVTVVFGFCWLPYHVYFLCTYQWPWLISAKATQHIYLGIYWLAMSNSMLNPIILLLMNRRFRRFSAKFLNFWPFTKMFPCIATAQQSLPSEACNTAIVTHGPTHHETQTVLLCNGLTDISPIDENVCAYENGKHHHSHNGYGLRKDSSQKSTRLLVASMSVRYSP